MLISLSVILLAYFTQETIVKFFNPNDIVEDSHVSILTYNSHGAKGVRWSRNPKYSNEIADFVTAENPDIVCFQEFSRIMDRKLKQYPYKYQTPFYNDKSRQAIYSKYKIIETGSLNFPNSLNNALYADILIKQDTLRIYNLHLQSLVVRPGSFKREQPQRLFRRLIKTMQKQQEQADLIKTHTRNINYRKIICGDFNNTGFSRVFKTIKGEMKDSFEEKGFGFGSTYIFKFLPFRIDFILTDPEIEIKSHKNFKVRLSDHEPVMASFRLKE
ncbi:MAG: endonuclease/exonuclease/phosphatase family protein [Maribacter sp.]|nr:endonuclease/exonuclease/phosphatase family protein [Maribacter sp.]